MEQRPDPVHDAIEDGAEASRDVLRPDDRSEEKHSADEDHDADSGDEECVGPRDVARDDDGDQRDGRQRKIGQDLEER